MQYWKCALYIYIVGLSQDCSYVFASAVELMQFALNDGYGSMLLCPHGVTDMSSTQNTAGP